MKIYINGKYYSKEDANISVFDHGLLYGDGVFEGIRIYNGTIFKLREHLIRLYESARAIMLDIGMTIDALENEIRECVRLNEKINGYSRIVVTRGEGALGIDPSSCKNATVIIIVGDIQLYPEEYYTKGISLITSSYQRIPAASFDVRIKSLNYLNNILAKIEARQAGCFECILLNTDGHVAECTADNIFFVKNGKLLTPSVTEGALDGITRRTVLDLAMKAGIETAETTLTRFDCYAADECFLTGTGAEIIPVVSIDHRVIGNGQPGTITQNILSSFTTFVRSIS
jgi:branched-chain amino acid aminotransferase